MLLQLLLVLASAPLVSGIIKKTKARFQRRKGAGVCQPYFDLAKLLKKEVVVSSTASWLFRVTPYLVFASTLVIVLLVPTVLLPVPLHWIGDIITVVYLFALGGSSLRSSGSIRGARSAGSAPAGRCRSRRSSSRR